MGVNGGKEWGWRANAEGSCGGKGSKTGEGAPEIWVLRLVKGLLYLESLFPDDALKRGLTYEYVIMYCED